MKLVSLYSNAWHSGTDSIDIKTKQPQLPPEPMEIETLLDCIKTGTYESRYNLSEIRELKEAFKIQKERCVEMSKEEISADKDYQTAKKKLEDRKNKIPRFTVAGVFDDTGRKSDSLKKPSGLIDIDLDELQDLEGTRTKLVNDKYVYCVFKTVGGDGLCALFHIESHKHLEAFAGIQMYLFKEYGITVDNAHKNNANTRNVSYDPELFMLSRYPTLFREYIKKPKKEEKVASYVYAKNDFEHCVNQIVGGHYDFCPDYATYRAIGFAIANKFGPAGLQYFNDVCQFGEKYNTVRLVKDYRYLCRNLDGAVKIATFFHRCKALGIEIYSKETKLIAAAASMAFKSGRTAEDVIKNLEIHEGLKPEVTREIVEQVFSEKIEFVSQAGILDDVQAYIKYNYSLKVNSVTGKFENNGVEWTEADFNSCLIDVKKVFDKSDAKWTERILFSNFIPRYNPFHCFFEENKELIPADPWEIFNKLCDSLQTKDKEYTRKFLAKWFSGAVSTWYGRASDLELIFAGEMAKGKSFFIRNILPPQLQRYYAEIKIEATKDCEIAMCNNGLINQNECGGRSRVEDDVHKGMIDKPQFDVRKPYRKDSEKMNRMAALFGTTNRVSDIITDRKGNRRLIVIEILGRIFSEFDAIDKTEFWMAVYAIWKSGFKWQILDEEIIELNQYSREYEEHGMEYELICKYFKSCTADDKDNLKYTLSDIKSHIEAKSLQKTRPRIMLDELARMNIHIQHVISGGLNKKYYNVKYNDSLDPLKPDEVVEEPPF